MVQFLKSGSHAAGLQYDRQAFNKVSLSFAGGIAGEA
jgi:hypothetical protein